MLGGVLMRMGEHAAAALELEKELELNPNNFDAHLLLGVIRRQEFEQEKARDHLQRALALRPGDPGVRYQLALVDVAAGGLESALSTLEELVALHPKWSEPHVSLATVYYRLNRRQDGDREQAIVRELMRESKANEASGVRSPGSGPPTP
jgi:Tfp pilus assembly protein PilF